MKFTRGVNTELLVNPDISLDDCWLYAKYINEKGYGFVYYSLNNKNKGVLAHRAMYEGLVGPIPEGLHLDHLCRVRRCINPEHLEPVTQAENNRRTRGNGCHKGHLWTDSTTFRWVNNHTGSQYKKRQCKVCERARKRRRYAELREEATK